MTPDQSRLLVWVLLGVAVYAVAYVISLRLHPYRTCRKCRGSGKHRGAMFERAFRACRACGGSGRQLRLFAKKP